MEIFFTILFIGAGLILWSEQSFGGKPHVSTRPFKPKPYIKKHRREPTRLTPNSNIKFNSLTGDADNICEIHGEWFEIHHTYKYKGEIYRRLVSMDTGEEVRMPAHEFREYMDDML